MGLAAVRWAQHVGAEVYATAGSEVKRAWLRAEGVARVSDSRSTQFVADVRAWTDGDGVDVVLNALAGPLREASFGLLRAGGRFVEIGKRDYLANRSLGLQPFLRGLSLTLLDLAGRIHREPGRVRQRMAEVLEYVRAGVLPPLPHRSFPLSRAGDALWEMARGQHVGKFVLAVAEPPPAIAGGGGAGAAGGRELPGDGRAGRPGSDAGALAGGARGGAPGAGRAGRGPDAGGGGGGRGDSRRRGPGHGGAGRRGRRGGVGPGLAPLTDLRGVVHAAGLLDDGLLAEQTEARFERVLRPKVAGARHLDRLTRGRPLDFFVLYGSAASVLGSPGQGNYAAANAYLAALAWRRRSEGLPALCLDWGAFAEVGLAAAQANRGDRVAARGMRLLTPDEGVRLFERLVGSSFTQVAPCPLDLSAWLDFYPALAGWPFVAWLVTDGGSGGGDPELLAAVAAGTAADAERLVVAHVIAETGRVLRLDPSQLAEDTPFTSLGLDSLMGLELRNRLQATCGLRLPATTVWTHPTPQALGTHLARQLRERAPVAAEVRPPPVEAPSLDLCAARSGADRSRGGRGERSRRPADGRTCQARGASPMTEGTGTTAQRMLATLRSANLRIDELEARIGEPCAVIGLGCRFPGGGDPASFWTALLERQDRIREVPQERLLGPWPEGVPRWAGLIDADPAAFDPAFFGISHREAVSLDPQQRLLLEVCWEALEDRAPGRRPPRWHAHRRVPRDVLLRLPPAAPAAFRRPARRLGHHREPAVDRRRPRVVHLRAPGSGGDGGHRVLQLARGGPSGVSKLAERGVRPGAGWRRQPAVVASGLSPDWHAPRLCHRTGGAACSTLGRTGSCGRRAAGWWCSSACPTRGATATRSGP